MQTGAFHNFMLDKISLGKNEEKDRWGGVWEIVGKGVGRGKRQIINLHKSCVIYTR